MKTNWIKTAGLIILATLLATGLNAQSPRQGGRGSGPYGQGNERMAGYYALDLTEDQQEAMLSLRTENYKTMKPLRNKMNELKARERTLVSEETVDMKAVHKIIDEQTELMNKMRKIQLDHRLEVREILSDEQIMKLDQRRNFSKNRRNKGNGPFQGQGVQRGQRGQRNARPYCRNLG
ncbi:MAG: Spy/CpxP family protein refolding chaperone [Bacteroidota bacterium]